MSKKRKTITDYLNDLTTRLIFDKYKLVALNAFEWDGLPDTVPERHLENVLFNEGKVLFFEDPQAGIMALPCHGTGGVNLYGEHVRYTAHGFNYHREFDLEHAVLVENNKLRAATRDYIIFYAAKLAEIERTADVNLKSNKTPVIVACDDKDVLSFKRLLAEVDGNLPAIYADRALNVDALTVLDLKARFICPDLHAYKKDIENELLTFLGQNNTPFEKKERLITDEATSNNGLIASFAELQLEARQRACDRINELFGLSVTVKRRVETVENSAPTVENSGGGDDNV